MTADYLVKKGEIKFAILLDICKEKIIQKLQHIKCANLSGRELIENIKQDVTDFEFDRALNKTEKLYKRVERGECE